MKIISTNIGEAKTVNWHGNEVKTGIFKYSVGQPIFLGEEDVDNDNVIDRKYHGGIDKACYLYSADHYNYWKKLYPATELLWGMFGENLTIEGLHEAEINIGNIYKVGGTIVQVTQPRQPCFKLDIRFNQKGVVKQFVDSGFPGVYIRILESGTVKTGDEFHLLEKKDSISIQKVFQLLYTTEFDKESVLSAISNKDLADSCRKDLKKRWEDKI